MSTPPPIFPSYTKTYHTKPTPAIDPTQSHLSAKGKSIIITGGGTGIGKQIALSFAVAGASNIGILGRREDVLIASRKIILDSPHAPELKVSYAVADTTNDASLNPAFEKMHGEFGKLDILVANAGYLNRPSSILDADSDNWWTHLEVNVRGTFNTIRAFMPFSRSEVVNGATLSKATILNISSGSGHLPTIKPLGGMSAYAASKIAGAKMIEYLGSEVPGLKVVNVQPGSIASEMSSAKDGEFVYDDPKLPGDFCVWLASSEADFLHGRFVWVNWDVDELKARAAEIESKPEELTMALQGAVYYS
ncbi:NAD(P)-binding protein [Cadophora sp. DSE1049]|nr:NAD(P)-binding protein [Cadophora sp. DSE1049]